MSLSLTPALPETAGGGWFYRRLNLCLPGHCPPFPLRNPLRTNYSFNPHHRRIERPFASNPTSLPPPFRPWYSSDTHHPAVARHLVRRPEAEVVLAPVFPEGKRLQKLAQTNFAHGAHYLFFRRKDEKGKGRSSNTTGKHTYKPPKKIE